MAESSAGADEADEDYFCEGICNSSSESEESVEDSDLDCPSLCEQVVEEDGEKEMILVPQITVEGKDLEKVELEESELFASVVASLAKEDIIKRSPRGKKVAIILEYLTQDKITAAAPIFNDLVSRCVQASKKFRLPSAAQAALWSNFHQLRCSPISIHSWSTFIQSCNAQEATLCFQLLADRMLKATIHKMAESQRVHPFSDYVPRPLTSIECNGIRYMAGYVANKLLKKNRKPSKNKKVQLKRSLCVQVLKGMKATDQPGEPDSLYEYTKVWSELIDRGGLYHINDGVFELFECIEIITRQHVNVRSVADTVPGNDFRRAISDDIQQSITVLTLWEKIADAIPDAYEKYSLELLQDVSDLWISVRGHSFAKDWNSKFQKKYKKATRKELQKKDSKKDSNKKQEH